MPTARTWGQFYISIALGDLFYEKPLNYSAKSMPTARKLGQFYIFITLGDLFYEKKTMIYQAKSMPTTKNGTVLHFHHLG